MTRILSPAEANYVEIMREQMKQVQQNLVKAIDHIENVTAEAIRFGLQPAFDKSQIYVPVDRGVLKRSGFIETRKRAGGVTAEIGYGRYGRPTYAAIVHERLDFRHAPPTQAKFLERAITEHIGDFRRRVEMFMRKNTGITP
jgi:hypothetical protein